ncbi:MAG: WecB/TagA/CpsF family glycosyltransferase [Chloroflexi bacterium]|nr:WecB/TagA/CpsF family glycosyltransferase [Chloroflexota bacterium]
MNHVRFLGVRVDDVTLDEAAALAGEYVLSGAPRQIATVNPEFVMAARRDPAFQATLEAADLCVPDGVGLMWGSWLLRRPLHGRVPGVDLVWKIAELAAERGWSLFLLGGRAGAAQATADRLCERFPRLPIAGVAEYDPNDPAALEVVRAAHPDVLLVAYGAPAQDLWIRDHAGTLGVPLSLGIGGTFDFISGRARRAPRWLRRLGLEWLHRLTREPWRWRRQLVLPVFAVLVLRQRWTAPQEASGL